MMLKEVEGLWHEQFGGTLPAEGFSWPSVELPGHGIEFGLSEAGEINALGEILTKPAVGVFVDAALPRAVRVSEVDRNAGDCGQPLVLRHLAPLIVGHGKASLRSDPIEDGAEAGDGRFRAGIVHPGQGHQQRGALDPCADGGRMASTRDQIAFPMAGNDALIDRRWSLMDAGHVGDGPPAIRAAGAWPATVARLSQAGDQRAAQLAPRHGVERRVDRLVTDLKRRLVRVHASQYACDLLGRRVLSQQALHGVPQGTVRRPSARGLSPSSSRHRRAAAPAVHDSRPPPAGAPVSWAPWPDYASHFAATRD